jgi:trehalose 6-phosphate phosphatase
VPPPTPKRPLKSPAAVPIAPSFSARPAVIWVAGLSVIVGVTPRTVTLGAILVFVSPAATLVEALEPLRSDPSHAAVLLDIDGTLAPIVRHADDAHVPEATRTLLIEIAKRYGVVGCVSGRRAQAARQIVAIGSIAYIGNHGGELLLPGATRVELDPEMEAWGERVRAFAEGVYTSEHQRLRVRTEDKQAIAAFHWRGAPDEEAAAASMREVAEQAQAEGFAVHWGRKVLEVRPPVAMDKGMGVTALLSATPSVGRMDGLPGAVRGDGLPGVRGDGMFTAALYVGDDATDIDAFRALRELERSGVLRGAVCAAVSSEEAPPELVREADLTIEGPSGVRGLLEALL